jgi:5-methylthioadenosine/S-adenosylhomocysteine deaminase
VERTTGTLIFPGWLITSSDTTPRQQWGIRVVGARIDRVDTAVMLREAFPLDEMIEAPNAIALPGFVNAHTHLYGTLAHGIPVDPVESFWSFLADYWWPKVEDRLDHAMIAASTDWVCAEMLRTGTTTFYDILEAPHSLPDALMVEREIVKTWGLRGVLSFEATERVSKENGQLGIRENTELIKECDRDQNSLVSGMMCFHTTFTCSDTFIQQAVSKAEELGVLVHAHCNEGVHEGLWCAQHKGMRTVDYYDSLGVLSPRFLASQCVQMSPRERELIAERGVRVTHMPMANCEVGGGIAPVPEYLNDGVTVGLGSDGYVNDFYEVMRSAALLHKARLLDPATMPAATVLHLATEGGAKALGLENVGRLDPGWSADIQLVDARVPTPITEHNIFDQLVLWRNGSHVADVMVAGSWRVRNAEVLNADTDAMRARVHEQAQRLWGHR